MPVSPCEGVVARGATTHFERLDGVDVQWSEPDHEQTGGFDGSERKLRLAGASAPAASATTYVHDSGSGRRGQQAPLARGGTSSPAAIQPGQLRCALA